MKTNVLIVDDEAGIREFVRHVLGSEKYDVYEAEDLAAVRRSLAGPVPGLVFLDLKLPDGNGLSMLPEMKQKWPASRVIILTSYGSVEAAEEAYRVDPHIFLLSKPLDAGTLRALVGLALSDNPAHQPAAR